ncbi:MAG: nicotinate (nicotinamide) nucleotide adenylyltransferase [Ardenticatenaceae bacterium]|nr:nicotinate (nicotinamide) nucleotide adenylyltransferase [Ardenticatenaceae bacterium]
MNDSPCRLGLLGGTFDPPHVGHLMLAELAREQLQLDKVLFLPAGQPPHKLHQPVSLPHHRLAMTRLAIAGNPGFALDTTDLDRPPPHYTMTLLPLLRQAYAPCRLWLLLGGDSLRDLPTWHDPGRILRCCRLGVLPRPGAQIQWERLLETLPQLADNVDWLEGPSIALSGTQIRQWAAAGRSLRYLTPPGVIDYIQQQALYRPG